jgi:predicted RNase H-like nuclease (RuvC/YqgF family)
MFVEFTNELIFAVIGAFLLGCILTAIVKAVASKKRSKDQDPRDSRIRALEAELRVARSVGDDSKTNVEKLQDALKETTVDLERREQVISTQQSKLEKVSSDLKSSVIKTRELRTELTERATQTIHAEAKIREVETELSVAHASTDMLANGVLDYPDASDAQNPIELAVDEDDSATGARKASS